MPRINPLPLIAYVIATNSPDTWSQFSRSDLTWEVQRFYETRQSLLVETKITWADAIQLGADTLLAAGIGRSEEQDRTVYCTCAYGD